MSKRFIKRLYKRIISSERIYNAINETRKSIRSSDAKTHLKNERLRELEDEDSIHDKVLSCITDENYEPKPYSEFTEIENGKERFIQSCSDTIDKVIQKLLTIELKRALEPMLYDYSLCNVKGRGIKRGVDYIKRIFKREERIEHFHKKNGISYKKATSNVLKLDVSKCYESIKKDKLRKMLESKIKDKKFITLLFKFVDKYKNGLGLGGGMCAVLANFYFCRIDEFILKSIRKKRGRHKGKALRSGYYLRYMDDIVIFCTSKAILGNILRELRDNIFPEYGFKVKSNWYISPVYPKDGVSWHKVRRVDFLGYTFSPKNIHLRKRIKIKIIRLLREAKQKGIEKISYKKLKSLSSYWGFIKMSDSNYLIKKYYSENYKLKKDISNAFKNRKYKKASYSYLKSVVGIDCFENIVKRIKKNIIKFGKSLVGK